MNTDCVSLRSLVNKWFAPTRSMPVRVTQTGRVLATHGRYVRLEGCTSRGPLTIVFFRHDDGSWFVFPPVPASPAMCGRLFVN
ncbi:hypothetical protein CJU94_01060 [Paraburkholderia aromaticivorans]|uniref:Uncharacterized protein n=1 Tax=Paraburkholderia aromaticivorans TaxID=2026199 RepID=A0A248VCU5_9BURK|nr:hypothetical protein [Paraburkholderia aromaticivorans]ASV96885.1 hypothetical protein CJU94_01060 [Paraburkholderia aromaticivorans]